MSNSVRRTRTALVAASYAALTLLAVSAEARPTITLEAALRRSFEHAPTLTQAQAAVDAERARLRQARLRPNPEATLDAENFAGSRDTRGFGAAELTASIEQPIELGGKRSARIGAGQANVGLAETRLTVARLDLELAVRRAYAAVTAAETKFDLARAEAATAAEIADAVGKLVAAGEEPPLRQALAVVESATTRSAVVAAERELEAAKRDLAALWGETGSDFAIAPALLSHAATSPALPDDIPQSADVIGARKELERARAMVRVERSLRTPDPRVTAGVRRLQADDATALVAGVAIPLPLFDRNGGNIAAANAEVVRAEATLRQAEVEAQTRASSARGAVEAAHAQVDTLDRAVLPAAEEALRAARLGYAAGKFPYLELLEAQRTLAAARRQRADALLALQQRQAELDRALGISLLSE